MLKKIVIVALFALVTGAGWYVFKEKGSFSSIFSSHEYRIFKARCTAQEIIAKHEKELLKCKDYSLSEPEVIYYPLLLMDVKYAEENKGRTLETSLLWGLSDGEMIVDTTKWQKTHGFEECMLAKVSHAEFVLIKEIVKRGSIIEKEGLYKQIENDIDTTIESCIKKKLIVEEKNTLRLHFENPRFETAPQTKMNEFVVILSEKPKYVAQQKYSPSRIEKFAHVVFGSHFAIKRSQEVFLPVYVIDVQHGDGTILKTYWNALNGARMDEHLMEI